MSNEQRAKDEASRPEDYPVAWFVVLERARRTNNFELAARARRELERLGVKVTYRAQPPKGGGHD